MSLADRSLLLNPWTYVVLVVVLAITGASGFIGGYVVRGWRCTAGAGKAAAKVERVEDKRDDNIDAIASAAAGAAAAAVNDNRSSTDESAERIRKVFVAAPCSSVPAPVLLELRAARDHANAALGVGVRPGAAGAGAADQ